MNNLYVWVNKWRTPFHHWAAMPRLLIHPQPKINFKIKTIQSYSVVFRLGFYQYFTLSGKVATN